MKTTFRNFLSVIHRFRLATILNILGLSVAFAVFMVVMIQLDYDYNFDKFHKDSDKIFRMECFGTSISQTSPQAIICRPLAERFFESSPHILAGAITHPLSWEKSIFFQLENGDSQHIFKEISLAVSPSFTDVFTFDFIEGDKDALLLPKNVMIPLSLSRKIFRDVSAVGKQLICGGGNVTVGAVYRDFPSNSIIRNYIYITIPENENKQNWNNWNYHVYFRVDNPSDVALLYEDFKHSFDAKAIWGQDFDWEESGFGLRFSTLSKIHYVTDVTFDLTPKSSKQTLMILFSIAIAIIVIAGINFTNFNTALTPMRVKTINTKRVLGAIRSNLRLLLVTEVIIVSLVSYILAILFVVLFHQTQLAKLVDADLSIAAHPLIVCGTGVVACFTGLLAGIYPAFSMTSFLPALELKGKYGLSPKGRFFRNILISIQFIASYTLIIGASFMYLQNLFMQHSPLGYNKDRIVTVDISKIWRSRDAITNQLKSFSWIEDVTYSHFLLSSSDQYMSWGMNYKGEVISFQCLPVDYSFLKVMGIAIIEGRDFRQEDTGTLTGAFVFNRTAQKKYHMNLNSKMDDYDDIPGIEIIGFIPDVKFASFRTVVDPMAFYVMGTLTLDSTLPNTYVRLKSGTDIVTAISHIRSTLAEFDPDYPFEVYNYDEVLQRLYEKEVSLSSLIFLLSIIAIMISLIGVFGLVVFDGECRRKEVGIRKVQGASTTSIIRLFNKVYFNILLICFVISVPLAWYIVHRWLEQFAYKTPMFWSVYLFAFAAVGIITIVTVTYQNRRVANENPVDTL